MVHFVPDPQEYAGLDVVIVGGGDSAVDWALLLEPIAKSVSVVHRRAAFRAHPHSVELMRETSVQIVTDAQVSAVLGDPVTGVRLTVAGESRRLPCDRLVAALGFLANLGPLLEWGLQIEQKRHIVVDTTMATSVPGLYAAGDICEYPGKVRLIATGFGEVATAVNNAVAYLDPCASVFPGHLSDYAPPGALGSPGTPTTVGGRRPRSARCDHRGRDRRGADRPVRIRLGPNHPADRAAVHPARAVHRQRRAADRGVAGRPVRGQGGGGQGARLAGRDVLARLRGGASRATASPACRSAARWRPGPTCSGYRPGTCRCRTTAGSPRPS